MASENIMMDAVKRGGNRQELHERIRVHSLAAGSNVKDKGLPNNLIDLIAEDPMFGMSREELTAHLGARPLISAAAPAGGGVPQRLRGTRTQAVRPGPGGEGNRADGVIKSDMPFYIWRRAKDDGKCSTPDWRIYQRGRRPRHERRHSLRGENLPAYGHRVCRHPAGLSRPHQRGYRQAGL